MTNLAFVVYSRGIDENIIHTLNILRDPKFQLQLDRGVFVVRGFNQESIRKLKRLKVRPLKEDREGGAILKNKEREEIHFVPSNENAEGPCIGWDRGLAYVFDRFWNEEKADYAIHLPVDLLYKKEDDAKDHLHIMKEKSQTGEYDLIVGDYQSGSEKDRIERYIREALFFFLPEFMKYPNVDSNLRPRSEFFSIRRDEYNSFRSKREVLPFELTIQLLIHLYMTNRKLGRVSLGKYQGFGDYPIRKVLHQMYRGSFVIKNESLQWSDDRWLKANIDEWREKETELTRRELAAISAAVREEPIR